ncbi:MAG: hypothetical protein IKE61_03785 [Coriobacteriales bacterium]|nr:hypothetical protein [Coriobacteriales bacterium]
MSGNRLFTDEELKDLSTRTIDKAKQAIDDGDLEKAKELMDLQYKQFSNLHDGYMTWVSGLQTYIYNHYGVEILEEAERFAHEVEARLVFKFKPQPDEKKRIAGFIKGMHGHVFQPMTVLEDDEKVTFIVNPCGSGGRLQEMGGYDPEIGLAKIKEACNITFQQEDFPIYCIHCPVMQAQEVERFGNFSWVKGYKDDKVGPCCVYHYYKDKADIPEKYYTEIGKEKPQAE